MDGLVVRSREMPNPIPRRLRWVDPKGLKPVFRACCSTDAGAAGGSATARGSFSWGLGLIPGFSFLPAYGVMAGPGVDRDVESVDGQVARWPSEDGVGRPSFHSLDRVPSSFVGW